MKTIYNGIESSLILGSEEYIALEKACSFLDDMDSGTECCETRLLYSDMDGNLYDLPDDVSNQLHEPRSACANAQVIPPYFSTYVNKVFNKEVKVASGSKQNCIELARLAASKIDVTNKASLAIMSRIFEERSIIKMHTNSKCLLRALSAVGILYIYTEEEISKYANSMRKKINGGNKNGKMKQNLAVNHIYWEEKTTMI